MAGRREGSKCSEVVNTIANRVEKSSATSIDIRSSTHKLLRDTRRCTDTPHHSQLVGRGGWRLGHSESSVFPLEGRSSGGGNHHTPLHPLTDLESSTAKIRSAACVPSLISVKSRSSLFTDAIVCFVVSRYALTPPALTPELNRLFPLYLIGWETKRCVKEVFRQYNKPWIPGDHGTCTVLLVRGTRINDNESREHKTSRSSFWFNVWYKSLSLDH